MSYIYIYLYIYVLGFFLDKCYLTFLSFTPNHQTLILSNLLDKMWRRVDLSRRSRSLLANEQGNESG